MTDSLNSTPRIADRPHRAERTAPLRSQAERSRGGTPGKNIDELKAAALQKSWLQLITKVLLVTLVNPVLAATREKVPALLTPTVEKVATPFTAVTDTVPCRLAPLTLPGLLSVSVTVADPVGFPNWSSIRTVIEGAIVAALRS